MSDFYTICIFFSEAPVQLGKVAEAKDAIKLGLSLVGVDKRYEIHRNFLTAVNDQTN